MRSSGTGRKAKGCAAYCSIPARWRTRRALHADMTAPAISIRRRMRALLSTTTGLEATGKSPTLTLCGWTPQADSPNERNVRTETMTTLHVVALSGGKDSTAMALRLAEVEPREYTYVCTPTGSAECAGRDC